MRINCCHQEYYVVIISFTGKEAVSMLCYVCPHRCGVDRPNSISDTDGTFGCCGVGILPVVSRAGVHMWEEPCLSGTKGAGTVFFTGCNLHCCYCQNYEISCLDKGKEISVARLKESLLFFPAIELFDFPLLLFSLSDFADSTKIYLPGS